MIIKIASVTPSGFLRLAQFLATANKLSFPKERRKGNLSAEEIRVAEEFERKAEGPFARIMRDEQNQDGTHNLVLVVQTVIVDPYGGPEYTVPSSYLFNLLRSMELFPEVAEHVRF